MEVPTSCYRRHRAHPTGIGMGELQLTVGLYTSPLAAQPPPALSRYRRTSSDQASQPMTLHRWKGMRRKDKLRQGEVREQQVGRVGRRTVTLQNSGFGRKGHTSSGGEGKVS